jgi:CheY-like chemotaxis protein
MGNCELSVCEGPTVLVVADTEAVRRSVPELLVKEGYSVTTASDGFAGVECLCRNVPDVILIDFEMPVMRGLEVFQALSTEQQLSSIILAITQPPIENQDQSLNAWADDYLVKPFAANELIARVRAGLRTALLKKKLAAARNLAPDAVNRPPEDPRGINEEQRPGVRQDAGVTHRIYDQLKFIQSKLPTLRVYARVIGDGSDHLLKLARLVLGTDKDVQVEANEILAWMQKMKLANSRQEIEAAVAEICESIGCISAIVKT